jgi:hypothetical protein
MTRENDDVWNLIAGVRGEFPTKCDFCQQEAKPEDLHPEEAGDWVCTSCLKRWGEWR